jgi:hypothetical protein
LSLPTPQLGAFFGGEDSLAGEFLKLIKELGKIAGRRSIHGSLDDRGKRLASVLLGGLEGSVSVEIDADCLEGHTQNLNR